MDLTNPDPWLIVLTGVLFLVMTLVPVFIGKWIRGVDAAPDDTPDDPTLDLAEPINRFRMQQMIDRSGLHGSLNIRDGRVLPCPNPEGRSALSLHLMVGYSTGLPANGNPNLMLAVYRDGDWVPTGVTLADLRDASICLEE